MRSTKSIQVISCHAEGEVGDVIIGGGSPTRRYNLGTTHLY